MSTEGCTLPAMISNLCGLFPNYAMGDDTMALRDSMYNNVACLTDLLHQAGYYQVYMGGAKSSFAGKGIFLKGHGYDEVMGWEQWKASGKYENNHSWWGLYDTDLFDEAIKKVRHLSDKEPFHLTLLSLNTHLPDIHPRTVQGIPAVKRMICWMPFTAPMRLWENSWICWNMKGILKPVPLSSWEIISSSIMKTPEKF